MLAFCCCDKTHEKINLTEEIFILAHNFRGCRLLAGSIVSGPEGEAESCSPHGCWEAVGEGGSAAATEILWRERGKGLDTRY